MLVKPEHQDHVHWQGLVQQTTTSRKHHLKEAATLVSRYQLIVVIANSQQQGRGASMAKRSTKSCLVDREVRCVTEGVKSGLVIG